MNRLQKMLLIIALIYVVILGIFAWLSIKYDWSIWIIFWMIVIPTIGGLIIFVYFKIKNRPKAKERTPMEEIEEKPRITKDKVEKEAKKYVLNHETLADNGDPIANLYVPQQEGPNKISYWIIKIKRYWNNDVLYLSTRTDRIDFEHSVNYDEDTPENEENFKTRLNQAVINPMIMAEIPSWNIEPTTGQYRPGPPIKMPVEYLKREQEKKKMKEVEKEEGAESGEEE